MLHRCDLIQNWPENANYKNKKVISGEALICMTHRKKGVGWHFSQYKGDNFYENVIK